MVMGIHEICLSGKCCYCRQAIELRGTSGGVGPRWDGGWQGRPEPGDRPAGAWYCAGRMDLARARGRTATGYRHRPDRASIQLLSAHNEPALDAEGIGLTRWAVMQKAPVSQFWPAGLLITGVPAGVDPGEVQAELEAARRGWFLRAAVGAFVAHAELGPRSDMIQAEVAAAERTFPLDAYRIFLLHDEIGLGCEIIAETEHSAARIREDRVRFIDWERLVAASQGRVALIRYDWQDLRRGGLPGLARKARTYRTATADRKRRIRLLHLR
jgi:hypothetical protein